MKELELYKVYVSKNKKDANITLDSLKYGFVIDKAVSGEELLEINQYYNNKMLDSSNLNKTLFSKLELQNTSVYEKVLKQILHYIDNNTFGVKEIELINEKFTFDLVHIVSKEGLKKLIENDLYNSKPLSKDKIDGILELINKYNFDIDFSKVKNNEFKVFNLLNSKNKLDVSGDDVVRAIIYIATENTLLIKSKEVLEKLGFVCSDNKIVELLNMYKRELSEVFNRHKKVFMVLKNNKNTSIINEISRLSKKNHKPIIPAINKIFINKYLNIKNPKILIESLGKDVLRLTCVDKMRLLSHIDVLLSDMPNRVFLIRNGKVFIKDENLKTKNERLEFIYGFLKQSLILDLKHLNGVRIKYPEFIDYALPISEKKSVSGIPFGTKIISQDNSYLTAGMYWKDSWGARDLDLSSISINGKRTGWGQVNSYARNVVFSGDTTSAPNGAIEYLANTSDEPVVLINNIYNGNEGSKFKIVVGNSNNISKNYIDKPIIELDCKFEGSCKNMTLGMLTEDEFILYPMSVGNKTISSKKDKAILPYMLVKHMMMKELLQASGAIIVNNSEYDIDLSYENITFDKLTNLFNKEVLTNNKIMV